MPVKLLLGRAMLLTRPSFTGSWLAMKTVGIVVVAALAAKGPRIHRGRATELSSRQFGVLCAEAALSAASTFHRSAVVDRVNIKSRSLHGLCRLIGTTRHCTGWLISHPELREVRTPVECFRSSNSRRFLTRSDPGLRAPVATQKLLTAIRQGLLSCIPLRVRGSNVWGSHLRKENAPLLGGLSCCCAVRGDSLADAYERTGS